MSVPDKQKSMLNKMAINEIYTDISEAILELEKRQLGGLKEKVEKFWGDLMPQFLNTESYKNKKLCFLSRYIATPNTECTYFVDIAESANLTPIYLEYYDKFVAKNPDKYHLAKLYTYKKNQETGCYQSTSKKIINFNTEEGKKMNEIKTLYDTPLKEFHHNILQENDLHKKLHIEDFTEWFNRTRTETPFYYFYFLSIFVAHGILLENYWLEDREEGGFFTEKLLPSFREVERCFGFKPLIVPLLPLEVQKHPHWLSYKIDFKDK